MANVQTSKCDKNLDFIFKKIGTLELQIKNLAEHLGLKLKADEK